MVTLSVVIPVYNSAAFVGDRLRELTDFLARSGIDHEVVAVDDGSTDHSAETIERLRLPRTTVVREPSNRGKFGAIARGMAVARGRCRIFTDADVPYDLAAIPRAAHLVADRGFHVVVGDRTLPESSYSASLGPLRRIATAAFTHCVRLFVTSGLGDTQCGFKAVRGDVADALFPLMREERFAGDVELLYIALKHNLTIRRIPVRLRFHGESSVSAVKDGLIMMRSLLAIRSRHRQGLYESTVLHGLGASDE